jgi:ferrous iron transporter FeoB
VAKPLFLIFLTGMNQKVGNWPGVTIERKAGRIRGTDYELIDLPGIYSFSPYTAEEEISRHFVFEDKPDLIINILDATNIERSLYLTTQLMELDCNLIIALNMSDLLEKRGVYINVERLSEELGARIVVISALKGTGVDKLVSAIKENERKLDVKLYPPRFEEAVLQLSASLSSVHKRFTAVKLLECDSLFAGLRTELSEKLSAELSAEFECDVEQLIADERYNFIERIKERTVTTSVVPESHTDKLDKVLLNKWVALPIFGAIMFLIYYLSVGVVGSATVDWVDGSILRFGEWFGEKLVEWNASPWAVSLVVDGIIAGVGAVLIFVPQLIVLFLCISILETTGYMSRIAFFLDKVFKKFGLSGKSLIPFIVGAGCSVPGIMTARTVEDKDERDMTIMLTPFIPCSAKLPIIALFSGYFFQDASGLVSASLYFFSIVIILMSAVTIKRLKKTFGNPAFICELPAYKIPSVRYVLRDVAEKVLAFIKRAGTIILVCSVIVWFFASFSWRLKYGVEINKSILADVGNALAWIFYPMLGEWSWGATVSAIQGLVAKEQVVSAMEIIGGLSEGTGNAVFDGKIFSFFTGASAYAYMVFNLFSAPCFGAIGAMHREYGDAKKTLKAVSFQMAIAWVLSVAVFGIGRFFEVIL